MSKRKRFGDDEQVDVPVEPTPEPTPVPEPLPEPIPEPTPDPVPTPKPIDEGDVVKKKIEEILASKLPEEQKREYIERLTPKQDEKVNRVPFSVYAKIRKIRKNLLSGMVAYPKAKGITLASLEEWDEIYKNF